MASVFECVEVVGRLLSTLEGTALEQAAEVQSRALSANPKKVKILTTEEKLQLSTGIAGLRLDEASKSRLLVIVQGKCECTPRKRDMQDFVSWPNFSTPSMWRDIAARPELALELLCQHLNSIGLINPTKDTQKSIAAHVVTAEFAKSFLPFSATDAKASFKALRNSSSCTRQNPSNTSRSCLRRLLRCLGSIPRQPGLSSLARICRANARWIPLKLHRRCP